METQTIWTWVIFGGIILALMWMMHGRGGHAHGGGGCCGGGAHGSGNRDKHSDASRKDEGKGKSCH